MPVAIGTLVDRLYKARAKRLELQREAKALQKQETEIKRQIIERLGNSKAEGISGRIATAGISRPVYPVLKDWEPFLHFAAKRKNNDDLLTRAVAREAWRARYDNKIIVPGTEAFRDTKLSLRKKGGRREI